MLVTRETSRVEIIVYPNHPSEFRVERSPLIFRNAPSNVRSDEHVISASTTKRMGEVAGRFEIQIKSPRDLRRYVQDGDWIDIIFTRHEAKYHVMRGVVMTISQNVTASSGATESTYTLIGEEFSFIFASQGFWFDQVTQGDFFPFIASRVWSRNNDFFNGRPDRTVEILLHSFLLPSNNAGAALWQLPDGMPAGPFQARKGDPAQGLPGKRMFKDYYATVNAYSHVPPRTSAIIPSKFSSNAGTVWDLALEFADTTLCELYTDLILNVHENLQAYEVVELSPFIQGPSTPASTRMAVIFRDLPFPNTIRDGTSAAKLLDSPYFNLPLVEVTPQQVASTSLSIHGELRKNMIFFGPALFQELLGNYIDLQLPLIDVESVKHHGVRRLDAVSRYYTDPKVVDERAQQSNANASGSETRDVVYRQMAYDYRNIVRDLHCMNHLFEIGGIEIAHSLPEVRIGTRIRIKGRAPDEDFTAYVEGVTHNWSFVSGSRTSLTVSHGWRGTDAEYVDALLRRIDAFQIFTPEYSVAPSASTQVDTSSADDLLYSAGPGDRNFTESATAAATPAAPPPAISLSDAELAAIIHRPEVTEYDIKKLIARFSDPSKSWRLSAAEREEFKSELELLTIPIDRGVLKKPNPLGTRTILPAHQKQASTAPATAVRFGRGEE